MTGATIDHIIAVTVLLTAMLLAMMTFNGLFAQALEYDTNRQVANKAVDIMNTICMSPGSPIGWGETDVDLSSFGLQDPNLRGYALSSNSLMRLTSNSQIINYSSTLYNNISLGFGGYLLTPVLDCVNYTRAADLLGLTGRYGFSLDIEPTLDISIEPFSTSPYLILDVDVRGPSLSLNDVSLNYYLFQVVPSGGENPPTISMPEGFEQPDSDGSTLIHFSEVTNPNAAYYFVVYAHLGGLNGVGYFSQDALDGMPQFIVPFVYDLNGTILLSHSWDVHTFGPPQPSVVFNSTFFVMTNDFDFTPSVSSTGHLNYGSKLNDTIQIPTSEPGILLTSYTWDDDGVIRVGSVVVPWGFSPLGVSSSFSATSLGSSGYNFVATELRQVTVDGISYQVKVSTWKLGN